MPIHEYQCEHNHITEKLFRTFDAAEGVQTIACDTCGEDAERISSVPFSAHLLGNPDGYHKPSPSKRHSTKVVSAKTGNKFSAG